MASNFFPILAISGGIALHWAWSTLTVGQRGGGPVDSNFFPAVPALVENFSMNFNFFSGGLVAPPKSGRRSPPEMQIW